MRVGQAVLAVTLALVVVAAAGYALVPRDQLAVVEPGGFGVEAGVVGEYSLGEHTVVVEGEQVRVESPGGTVWASSPGTAFLSAAHGQVEWEEERGYFWPDVSHGEVWDDQQLTGATVDEGLVELTGRLRDGDRWEGEGVDADGGQPGTPPLETEFTVQFTERPGGGVVAEVEVVGDVDVAMDSPRRPDVIRWTGSRAGDAGVHGFGEQFDDFDLSGRLVPIVIREQGVGRGEQPLTFLADVTNGGAGGTRAMTYATWPSYVTGDLQGVRLDPDAAASYAFAIGDTRTPDLVGLDVWASEMRVELTRGDTPAELIETQHTGVERPRLADWTQDGAIVGIQGGTEKVRTVVDDLERAGTEISGVWLQDWTGRRTTEPGSAGRVGGS